MRRKWTRMMMSCSGHSTEQRFLVQRARDSRSLDSALASSCNQQWTYRHTPETAARSFLAPEFAVARVVCTMPRGSAGPEVES